MFSGPRMQHCGFFPDRTILWEISSDSEGVGVSKSACKHSMRIQKPLLILCLSVLYTHTHTYMHNLITLDKFMKGSKSVHPEIQISLYSCYMYEPSALLVCRRVWTRAVRPRKEHQGEVTISLLEILAMFMKGKAHLQLCKYSVFLLMCMGEIKLNLLSTLLVFLCLYPTCFL